MTKKPSEKNKAWEKDRRDRLNKTFDELAKLLPKFDPSVVWSKIEIIQKAIAFIADLQKRFEDYLAAKDPVLLKEYKEFVNCIRFYQERNALLTELLKKAKVTLPPPPPVALPQLLIDKPELLPKEENKVAVVGGAQKSKRKRNRTKKGCDDAATKKLKEPEEKKETPEVRSEKVTEENKLIKQEAVVKPTAIITAFGRETPNDVPKTPLPQLPPSVPAKPLLLRIRKLRKRHQRLKLIARPTFRKCYPHPSKMLKWTLDSMSNRKLLLDQQQRRQSNRRKLCRKEKLQKRLKTNFNHPEPMREQSVSPTAAFLLSFPVVTSSMLGGKNVENADSSVNLENLNNFFTTEEYSKFCDQNTVDGDKILSPLPEECEDKTLTSEKPMTEFTVSAITRPSTPKKASLGNGNRLNGISSSMSFNSCFSNGNPMIGSTSMCGTNNNQKIATNQYSSSNSVPSTGFPSINSAKLSVKQDQINPTNTSEKFFPRYNHSIASSLRITQETPAKGINRSPSVSQKGKIQSDLPSTSNWSVKSATPRGKSISNQTSSLTNCKPSPIVQNSKIPPAAAATKPPEMPNLSPIKNFFYDFPTQNKPYTSASSTDPLISSTAALKPHRSVKAECPWLPPNTQTTSSTTCSQNTPFTPFDLATIVCETLTSTSFTFSMTIPKSSGPTVVEAGNKTNSNSRCNQINLFLPYEEAQYTPTFPTSQIKSTEGQLARETSWKSLEKQKDTSADQIFYDCEQSKPQQKPHVNWMTSPTVDYSPTPHQATSLPLPPIDFGNQFAATPTNFDFSFGCRKDSYDDDNQFINWSPTKPLNVDFSTAYSFENFGSNEPPPNKTVKQIFSVSQLVDQTPSQGVNSSVKKAISKVPVQKSTPTKQTFSNIYSAESLIAKKDNSRFYSPAETAPNNQPNYHNSSNYFFNYPSTQSCSENDYLGASAYSAPQQTLKTTSLHPSTGTGVASSAMPPTFDSTATGTPTNNYFSHTISSNNNDPYDPTYFPSSNYNQSWNQGTASGKAVASLNVFNQSQFGTMPDPSSCQQTSNVTGNLTNFNLSSICPEIDGKDGPTGW